MKNIFSCSIFSGVENNGEDRKGGIVICMYEKIIPAVMFHDFVTHYFVEYRLFPIGPAGHDSM